MKIFSNNTPCILALVMAIVFMCNCCFQTDYYHTKNEKHIIILNEA